MTLTIPLFNMRASLLAPYEAYKALKAGSRPFMVWRTADYRFVWGLPVNMRSKYTNPINGEKWKIKQLLP